MGLRDFVDGFRPGPTKPGTWRNMERFGRFQGTGEVTGDLELPPGEFAVSVEGHRRVSELDVELTGPDGEPVQLERHREQTAGGRDAVHNLHRVAKGELDGGGVCRLRLQGPDREEELIVVVGRETGAGEAMRDFVPGAKLLRRLRGG
jgi:hypothetical protein